MYSKNLYIYYVSLLMVSQKTIHPIAKLETETLYGNPG